MAVTDILGWTGAVMTVVAYGLLSMRRISVGSFPYQAVNLVGGLFLAVNAGSRTAYPSALLNIIWAMISAHALLRMRARR